MTSETKLRRYDDKDYSEVVEFPVELVDRDGVIRLYSYEDSLRVYLRRIASAPWRYADDSLIAAEVDHCNKRIDQLRRSYLLRCKNIGAQLATQDRTTDQCVIGEGLTILNDHLGEIDTELMDAGDAGQLDLEITSLAEEQLPAVYQVVHRPTTRFYLLYVFPNDEPDAEDTFDEHRAVFENAVAMGGDRSERLHLARRGEMAFFLLTERVAVVDQEAVGLSDQQPSPADLIPNARSRADGSGDEKRPALAAFTSGLAALRRREPERAVSQLKRTIELNPYHREAYLALSTLLDMTGDVEEGGLYASMAAAYYPRDGLIRFALGLNLLRRGRRGEALEEFERAAALDGALYQPRYFAGLLLAMDGEFARAEQMLARAVELTRRERERVELALGWVRARRRLRRLILGAAGSCGLAAVGLAIWSPWAAAVAVFAAVTLGGLHAGLSRLARQRLARSTTRALSGVPGETED
ncbi:MAG: hypothetical protein QGH45_20460 [Myxococcota bacterium]|jgi:tetratricopeptide (TPR) repeat protein|nr:hypothetical protein [Myxococcota bacterium]